MAGRFWTHSWEGSQMKWYYALIHPATLIGLAASVCGQVAVQSSQASSTDDLKDLKPGVVVEEVKKNSAADQARIQAGDVLLSWSRGDAKGQIESPFDVSLMEFEQVPRGTVTLDGLRGTEKRTWTLGPYARWIQARPAFSESLLAIYSEGR